MKAGQMLYLWYNSIDCDTVFLTNMSATISLVLLAFFFFTEIETVCPFEHIDKPDSSLAELLYSIQ